MNFLKIHDIHPYHAKFYPGIPQYFLKKYANPGCLVLDPFCGCGTTLLECNLQGYESIGLDINFLSAKISKAKTNTYSSERLSYYYEFIYNYDNDSDIDFKDSDLWFSDQNYIELCKLFNAIESIVEENYRILFEVVLSSLLNKVCNKRDTWNLGYLSDNILPNKMSKLTLQKEFEKRCKWLLEACKETEFLCNKAKVFCCNSANYYQESPVDIVITSPPYPFAVDFARNNRLSYYLFKEDVEQAAAAETGSRYKRNKKHCEEMFFQEMKVIYLNVMNLVRCGGYFCMTVADTKRNNRPIQFVSWLIDLFEKNGWAVKENEMRQLQRQSMGQKRIPEEHVLVLQKY